MAKRRDGDETPDTETTTTQATTSPETAVEDGATTVRRGLGAPPPGTKGDPSVKPIEPGESG